METVEAIGHMRVLTMEEEGSSTAKKAKTQRDRVSNLPESVLHCILSFMEMSEVMQTSSLSTRWRYLWISLPVLNFFDLKWKHNKDGFINFIDNVLLFRNNTDLHKFYFDSAIYCFENHIGKWITSAVRKRAEEVHLKIWSRQSYELPNCLFLSSVKVLSLKSIIPPLQLPTSMCSSSFIKTLELVSSKLPKGDSNGELTLTCPVLENLAIHDCDQRHLNALNIFAFQLKSLILKNRYPLINVKIKISTPSLIHLELKGYFYQNYSLQNFASVVTADIGGTVFSEEQAPRMLQLIQSLIHIKTLLICIDWSQYMKSSYMLRVPVTFDNLRTMKLVTLRCHWILACTNLLERCPHIETLHWVIDECGQKDEGRGCGETEMLSNCRFNRLKYVEVQKLRGCEHELIFLENLMRNGVVHENITITTTTAVSRDREKQLKEFYTKLQRLFKASSNISVLFLLKS